MAARKTKATGGRVKKVTGGRVKKVTGGRVKKQRGGRSELTHMASGEPIQWQQGPVGQKRKADYMSYMAPKVAKKQLKKKPPGRAATQGIGMKKGGRVSKAKGGKAKR
jgi:hypothetical protein